MSKNRFFIFLFILIAPLLVFSQKLKAEMDTCISINSFQLKCEKGLLDMNSYLNDSTLMDSDHINIMYCYNQLHWDIIGESIDRLQYRDTIYRENSTLSSNRFSDGQLAVFSTLFEAYQIHYNAYIDSLLLDYESSFGQGGALYIDRLNTYPSTATGSTYFILCE